MLRPSGTHSHVKSIVYIRSDKIHEIREMSTPKKCANCFFGWWVLFTLFNPVVYREVEEALPHLDHPRLLSEVNIWPFMGISYKTLLKMDTKSTKISSAPIWKILASLELPNLRRQSEYGWRDVSWKPAFCLCNKIYYYAFKPWARMRISISVPKLFCRLPKVFIFIRKGVRTYNLDK